VRVFAEELGYSHIFRCKKRGFGKMRWLEVIPKSVLKRMRFLAISLLASALVLLPGALWYKATLVTMSESSARHSTSLLSMQMVVLRQQMVSELAAAIPNFWSKSSSASKIQVRRDMPFDIVVLYDGKLRFLDGFRTLSGTKESLSLTAEAAHNLVPAASNFFDRVVENSVSAGILIIDDRPLIVSVQALSLTGGSNAKGFALVGRWLFADALASSQELAESKFEIFPLMDEAVMPLDVRESIGIAQRNNGYTYDVDRSGSGYVYTLLDDISDRPALLVKAAWTMPLRGNGVFGFGIYYIVAGLVGFGVWGALTRNDVVSRRRVRRFDGLSSLTTEHIATFVGAFPGYAIAIRSDLQYIAVSQILAGVTGEEPTHFVGKEFGTLACERNDGMMVKLFTELRDPNRWPRVGSINYVVESLGQRSEFSGMAHYLAKQDLLLVILSPREATDVDLIPKNAGPEESTNQFNRRNVA
jgi:hypothetical protein